MNKLNVYSSAPLSVSIVCAFQNVVRKGTEVVVQPLSDMPPSAHPGMRVHSLRASRTNMQIRLAVIGEQLGYIEDGIVRPEPGFESGLRFEREALLTRVKAISTTLLTVERYGLRDKLAGVALGLGSIMYLEGDEGTAQHAEYLFYEEKRLRALLRELGETDVVWIGEPASA